MFILNRFNRLLTNNFDYMVIRSFSRTREKIRFRNNKSITRTNYIDMLNLSANPSKYSNLTNSNLIDSNIK